MAHKGKEKDCKASSSNESLKSPACNKVDCHGIPEDQATSSTGTSNPSPGKSTTCSITPSNIHSNHLTVCNFSPEIEIHSSLFDTPFVKFSSKSQSSASSSSPICRICHEEDDLVSPCRCAGTVGLVHKKCMEKWLSSRNNAVDKCEICNYPFVTTRTPKSYFEFIQSITQDSFARWNLVGSVTGFFLFTPFAIAGCSFIGVEVVKKQVFNGNSLQAGCLMAIATFLLTIYIRWNVIAVRSHIRDYLKWRKKNLTVKLMKIRRISTESDGPNSTCMQIVVQEPSNSNTNGSIPEPLE